MYLLTYIALLCSAVTTVGELQTVHVDSGLIWNTTHAYSFIQRLEVQLQ